jgi:RimJ/RimL family protein N-acetyltransferase
MTITKSPSWPARPVAYGPVVLREFSDADLLMVQELSTDPYVPLIGTLPPNASRQEAQDYIDRQRGRLAEGVGFSFAIAEAATGRGVGGIGLWLAALDHGRATTGERAGFKREGLLRSYQEIGGRRRDMLLYATIRENPD